MDIDQRMRLACLSLTLAPIYALATNNLPSSYPAEWNVIKTPAQPLPAGYAFGRETTTIPQGTTYPPAAMPIPCDIVWERDIPVTLRDGTVIYTDMLRPADQATNLPSIISWSPYGKALPTTPQPGVIPTNFSGLAKSEGADAAFFACHGYAIVNPDARGAYMSGGDIYGFGRVDAGDLYDVIEWTAAQPWSSGKVATYGSSWLAITQWFAASYKPPHLTAIAPWNGFSDFYRDVVINGGITDNSFVNQVFDGQTGMNNIEQPGQMAARDVLMNEYWTDKRANYEGITVPAYVVADGVTSLHPQGALEAFRRIGSKEKWLRINDTQEWADQYDPKYESDVLRFFDHYLKGIRNGWEATPKVRVSVIDAGGVDKEDVPFANWPVTATRYERLYLNARSASMSLNPNGPDAVAQYDATTGNTTFTYTFNRDTQIVGYIKAHLFVEAAGSDDMDVFVLAEKLAADGTPLVPQPSYANSYYPIPAPGSSGRLRASLREPDPALTSDFFPVQAFTTPAKLSPGQVVPLDVAMIPRGYFFHAGQKLRLTIAGQVIDTVPPVPTVNAGTHIIHTGDMYPSYLQVPVVPIKPFETTGAAAGTNHH